MKANIKLAWEATDIGELTKIVGIEITLCKNSVSVSQQKYFKNILWQEHMHNANPVGTPLDPDIQLESNMDGNQGDWSNSYTWLLGELQWVANAMWPDIAYAVNKLAVYTANPSLQHISALKWILHYLARTKSLSITYTLNPYLNRANKFILQLCWCCLCKCQWPEIYLRLHVPGFRASNYLEVKEANNACLIIN